MRLLRSPLAAKGPSCDDGKAAVFDEDRLELLDAWPFLVSKACVDPEEEFTVAEGNVGEDTKVEAAEEGAETGVVVVVVVSVAFLTTVFLGRNDFWYNLSRIFP